MKRIAVVALALVALSANAEEWWVASGQPMAYYIAAGFEVEGFSVIEQKTLVAPLVVYRYLLKKDAALVMCSEKVATANGKTFTADCYELRPL